MDKMEWLSGEMIATENHEVMQNVSNISFLRTR